MTNMGSVVKYLKLEHARLTKQIHGISAAGTLKISAAGRARIAAAQRARWVKVHQSHRRTRETVTAERASCSLMFQN
jgi:hypothetical protein